MIFVLRGSVATYLMCGGSTGNKAFLLEPLSGQFVSEVFCE